MIRSVLVASALIVASFSQAPTPPSGQQLPTFRTGVDVVELDVTVLDKDRRPVRGLTAADFTILERGKPQPIVAFSAVDVPAPVSYSAPWMRDAPNDVVSNAENRRLVTIVMDDAYTGFSPDAMQRAKALARAAIDQLGPNDMAAVVFTFLGRMQNFTSDRSRLLRAVDSYTPKLDRSGGPVACDLKLRSCDIETLSTVVSTLASAPAGRKIVVLIGGGRRFAFGRVGDAGIPSSGTHRTEATDLVNLFQQLQRANITIYAFDAHGLTTGAMSAASSTLPPILSGGYQAASGASANESLHSFAESTGGRAITNTNDPVSHVAPAFQESATYYFIGFRSTGALKPKEFRKVEVKVNRPELNVRTRNGYYAPGTSTAPVDVINGLPGGDLPIHTTSAVFAVPGQKAAEVILAASVDDGVAPDGARTIDLSATAVDLDGKSCGTQEQTITTRPASGPGTQPDLQAHLPLKEGRYLVQLSANAGGRSGVVVVDVDVPNFSREALSASGLIIGRPSDSPVTDKTLADLVPFLPSTQRQFQPKDDVAVFLRVYQSGQGKIASVRILAKVTDDKNVVRSNLEAVLDAASFSADRSADYQLSLPLAHLSAGAYLLEVEAQSGERRIQRTARFSVR
jgi:VWFA-related protein